VDSAEAAEGRKCRHDADNRTGTLLHWGTLLAFRPCWASSSAKAGADAIRPLSSVSAALPVITVIRSGVLPDRPTSGLHGSTQRYGALWGGDCRDLAARRKQKPIETAMHGSECALRCQINYDETLLSSRRHKSRADQYRALRDQQRCRRRDPDPMPSLTWPCTGCLVMAAASDDPGGSGSPVMLSRHGPPQSQHLRAGADKRHRSPIALNQRCISCNKASA